MRDEGPSSCVHPHPNQEEKKEGPWPDSERGFGCPAGEGAKLGLVGRMGRPR